MPWSQTFKCCSPRGHVFEYFHMGSRETCPEFVPCEVEINIAPGSDEPVYGLCSSLAEKCIGTPYLQVINKKNSDFKDREKKRLTERSQAHWQREGRHEAQDRIVTQRKKDVIS